MPRVRGGDQRMISLRSLSISLGPECLLSARAAKQALEKYEEAAAVSHISPANLSKTLSARERYPYQCRAPKQKGERFISC